MSERVFIFIASGEACATCEGLHGTEVPAGFTPHENCNCNTVAREDGTQCEFVTVEVGRLTSAYQDTYGLELVVKCPDGSTISMSMSAEISDFASDVDQVEEMLTEACNDCDRRGSADDDFLCC